MSLKPHEIAERNGLCEFERRTQQHQQIEARAEDKNLNARLRQQRKEQEEDRQISVELKRQRKIMLQKRKEWEEREEGRARTSKDKMP